MKELARGGVPLILENPTSSYLWHDPELRALLEQYGALFVVIHMCQFGIPYRESTRLAFVGDFPDFGVFGNSRPFRIRIINRYNDNFDHYYVKVADASRVYGLELEHILSPTRINYLVNGGTLIEEHIAGLPGNVFLKDLQKREDLHAVRVAKEFVKFNERCFVRLLGDMRSVNYVVDMTPDFEEVQYRVRPIDFDQQSYEGNRKIYLAQFFADNFPIVDMVMNLLNQETIEQYQKEERTLISRRYRSAERRVGELLDLMSIEQLSTPEKTKQLNQDLTEHYQTNIFKNADTMGKIVRTHIEYLLGLS